MVRSRSRYSNVQCSPDYSEYKNQNKQEKIYPGLNEKYDNTDNDNVSYESDHEYADERQTVLGDHEYAEKRQTVSGQIWDSMVRKKELLIVLIIGIIAVVYFAILNHYPNSNDDRTLRERYKQQVISILRKNFPSEYENGTNTKAVLRLVGEKWIYQKPIEPYVILIVGAKADMLADALGDVFSNVTGKGEIDRIFCNEYKERQLLEREVTKSLSKYSKSVILYGIDRLRGPAPLCLHSVCDPDHSPFPSSLILLTINSFFGPHPSCEDAISNHLLNMWNSDYISEDQIRPILSRISSFLICLED